MALISSGGLGHEVSPLLRGAALPGAAARARASPHGAALIDALDAAGGRLRDRGSSKGVYLEAVARALRPLQEPGSRRAFLQTLRSVIDVHGQHVSATDRLYLLGDMATLIVWGERDRTIPIVHGRAAHEAIPHCRFETLPRAAHFPHLEDPEGLAATLADFLATTAPVRIDDSEWAAVIAQQAKQPAARRRLSRVAAKESAGVLLYRDRAAPELLLVHPGGPFWAKKDLGAWSIPKGEPEEGEELRRCALRELGEELGPAAPRARPAAT